MFAMSRSAKTDKPFDRVSFATVIRKAQGDRSTTAYAKEAGLSVSQVSRYSNKLLSTAPNLETIRKLANAATNGITSIDLLEAAGYEAAKYPEFNRDSDMARIYKRFVAALVSSRDVNDVDFKVHANANDCDLLIEYIRKKSSRRIHYEYLYCNDNATVGHMRRLLLSFYGKIAVSKEKQCDDFGFVTNSLKLFEYAISIPPYKIAANISAVLVDTEHAEVVEEHVLQQI